jgi:putative exporter of polyketide antibiotics
VLGKIIIWLVLGVLIALIGRAPALAKTLWWVTIALATIAAYLALNKPF